MRLRVGQYIPPRKLNCLPECAKEQMFLFMQDYLNSCGMIQLETCILADSHVNHLWYSCQVAMVMQSSISRTHTHLRTFPYVCHSSHPLKSNLNLQSHQLLSSLTAQVWHLHCQAASAEDLLYGKHAEIWMS